MAKGDQPDFIGERDATGERSVSLATKCWSLPTHILRVPKVLVCSLQFKCSAIGHTPRHARFKRKGLGQTYLNNYPSRLKAAVHC